MQLYAIKNIKFSNRNFLFSILFIFVCVSIVFYSFYTSNSGIIISKLIESNKKCSALFPTKTNSQYSVQIDNISYPRSVPIHMNKSLDFTCLNKSGMHTILFWNKPKWWNTDHDFRSCPLSNCNLIFDKTKLNQSDLVLFHLHDRELVIPKRNSEDQRWILALYESPLMTTNSLKNTWWNSAKLIETFNLSSTYRIDSDFPVKI